MGIAAWIAVAMSSDTECSTRLKEITDKKSRRASRIGGYGKWLS
jgi:hypothetical protein